MYNDYYLDQISNKLSTSNNNLQEIINNQEAILQYQQTLISGDNKINETLINNTQNLIGIEIVVTIIILYNFIRGCFRC